jgi:hypothetical protein
MVTIVLMHGAFADSLRCEPSIPTAFAPSWFPTRMW